MMKILPAVIICFIAGNVSAQLCPGVCDIGDTLVNPQVSVTIDGVSKPCLAWSSEFQNLPTSQCSENQIAARDAGCKCGIPIVCDGICDTSGGQVLYNPGFQVTIDENTQACASFDTLIKGMQLQDECDDASQAAIDAGCRCGEPVPCLGICPGSQLSNPGNVVMINGQTNTCASFDSLAIQGIMDPDGCTDFRSTAIEAGCMCVGTSPTDAPTSLPVEPTTATPTPESSPSPVATGTPNTPLPTTDAPISDTTTSPPSATPTTGPSASPSNTPITSLPTTDAPITTSLPSSVTPPSTDEPTSSGILFTPVSFMTTATFVLWMTWLF